ncbi:unnamed protein product [Brugia timori]|uniref:Uncharacterized protein n=1 Tax=Brugia timori TaxID=42155 RepID=A0A3P7TZ72_9BILA|nr:unnamed protein product [Brugia timori]
MTNSYNNVYIVFRMIKIMIRSSVVENVGQRNVGMKLFTRSMHYLMKLLQRIV